MEKIVRLNSRISINCLDLNNCEFILDGEKKAQFIPQDSDLLILINKLCFNGVRENDIYSIQSKIHRNRAIKFIENLEVNGFVEYIFQTQSNETFIIVPTKKTFELPNSLKKIPHDRYISKFTYLRFENSQAILTNPLASFNLIVDSHKFDLQNIASKAVKDMDKSEIELVSILLDGKFMSYEKNDCRLKEWEFHDLIFHTQSRLGMLDDSNLGGTFRFGSEIPEEIKTVRNLDETKYFQLEAPHNKDLTLDTSFFDVLYKRKSTRTFGQNSVVPLDQISKFMYHSANIKGIISKSHQLDVVKRVFPSAGSIHDLEFYLIINRSEALPKDIYYYHPKRHGLYRLESKIEHIDYYIKCAQAAMGGAKFSPPVMLVLTSKFKKVAWKYEKIAYRNIMLSVGAAYQTMYLVGSALNLSTCAIGLGNPSLFAEAINVNQYEECAVGEFVLGYE